MEKHTDKNRGRGWERKKETTVIYQRAEVYEQSVEITAVSLFDLPASSRRFD